MKQILLLFTFLTFNSALQLSYSQTNEWVWVNGDSVISKNTVYGQKGVPSPTNKPGGRNYFAGWTDTTGNLWMFGGQGLIGEYAYTMFLNDLWKYDIATNEWTWMNGDSVGSNSYNSYSFGVYGTRGVPSPANVPGDRYAPLTWTDHAGNLWLFGGGGLGATYLNDLWMYNIASNEWTWVGGDSVGIPPTESYGIPGVYGTLGQPDAGNKPGGRLYSECWTDRSGNLWLFGGDGVVDSTWNFGALNDLWEYNITNNEWTWVSGDSSINSYGTYGTKGTPGAGNIPGARCFSVTSTDNAGNLWLFGGTGYTASQTGYLNDLWEYNTGTNQWTWVKGDSTPNTQAVYGTKGVAAGTNDPGGRCELSGWTDKSGNMWLFGGNAFDDHSTNGPWINDLWKYNIATNQWTWISGDSVGGIAATFGTKGVAAATNVPGARLLQVTWTDNNGNFWLFAGYGLAANPVNTNVLNDLWRFNQPISVAAPVAQFSALPDTICAGSAVTFTDHSTGAPASRSWFFTGGIPDTSTQPGPIVTYGTPGIYPVTLVVSNSGGADTLTRSAYITVNPLPVPVLVVADTVFCSGDSTRVCTGDTFSAYLWNTGDASSCTYAPAAGGYWVTVTDANHCSAVSGHQQINVYPVTPISYSELGDTVTVNTTPNEGQILAYQWYCNENLLSADTGSVYVACKDCPGPYVSFQVTDSNHCITRSNNIDIFCDGISTVDEGSMLEIYPNPNAVGNWQLAVGNELLGGELEVFDVQGRILFNSELRTQNSKLELNIPPGVYYLRISNPDGSVVRKLVKM